MYKRCVVKESEWIMREVGCAWTALRYPRRPWTDWNKASIDIRSQTAPCVTGDCMPTLYELTEKRRHIRQIRTYFSGTFPTLSIPLGNGTLEIPSPVALWSNSSGCANRFFTAQVLCRACYRIYEYSTDTRMAINYRVAQNRQTPGSLVKFVIWQWFEINPNNAGAQRFFRNPSQARLQLAKFTSRMKARE